MLSPDGDNSERKMTMMKKTSISRVTISKKKNIYIIRDNSSRGRLSISAMQPERPSPRACGVGSYFQGSRGNHLFASPLLFSSFVGQTINVRVPYSSSPNELLKPRSGRRRHGLPSRCSFCTGDDITPPEIALASSRH